MTQTAPPSTLAPRPPVVADNVAKLVAYTPGKPIEEVERELGITGIIKLASNENSLGPSPRAVEAIHKIATKMHIYPDANVYALRQALAAYLNVSPETLVFGNGSDDIIHLLGVTFLEADDEVIQGDPSFVRYESAALLNNCPCHMVPLTSDWVHDLDAMVERINAHTRLIFIANPNNPTGTIVSRAALDRFLEQVPERAIVVLDEAYYEYAAPYAAYPDALDYVRDNRNVVVLRTFSKAFGLAGLRIGYGVMRPEIAGWLDRSREPFNVNYIAQVAAIAALEDVDHVANTVSMNEAGKQAMSATFDELGLPYTQTYANFMWVDVKRESKPVYEALMRQGVIVRVSPSFRAPTFMRVTIGTEAENAKFLQALRTVLA